MCSDQGESGRRVIEPGHIIPCHHGMASFTTQLPAVDYAQHSRSELTIVRIAMADGAGKVRKSIRGHLRELPRHSGLVAFSTWHRKVCAGQPESALRVHCKCKGRRLEALDGVAGLAAIQIRCGRKLSGVLVLVTAGASGKFHFVQRVDAARNVTLGAGNGGMFPQQRIRRDCMFFQPKLGGLESRNGVTGRTLATVCALDELTSVWIRSMAIHALSEGERLAEVAAFVAVRTTHRDVFAQQRILRLVVIEVALRDRG